MMILWTTVYRDVELRYKEAEVPYVLSTQEIKSYPHVLYWICLPSALPHKGCNQHPYCIKKQQKQVEYKSEAT